MLSFKEYITELFDKVHPFVQTKKVTYDTGVSIHQYTIHHPDGKKYKVHIEHDPKSGNSTVGFQDQDGRSDVTGGSKAKASGVIGSVKAVIAHHVGNTPTVKSVSWAGNEEGGRKKAYTAIAARHGGWSADMGAAGSFHGVDVDKMRAA